MSIMHQDTKKNAQDGAFPWISLGATIGPYLAYSAHRDCAPQ